MLRKGMFLADRYEILDQIGTGGMSDVYKAKCHKLNRFVAIKVLKQEFSQDKNFVSKFRIEAQSAAGLTHPNVVNVYDVGDEDGIHYIVMELVEGITLKRYIEKKGKLTSKEAVSIAIQVAQGIEAAHSHHIIHRDIKPQNIIISKEGKVKVTDFGIARASTTNTINSAAMGSVHYISPEQARGGYSDERSDIYSFGITLYEMITGTVPFDGDSTVAVAVQHIQDEIAPPSQVVDEIPISVDKIFMKCTQKKTERRYQNATDLITDLKKSLVMPNVDFVKMVPVYGDTITSDVEAAELKTDIIDVLDDDENDAESLDDLDEDDALLEEDDSDEAKDADDEEDDDDIEDGSNEKLDKIMKWIGVGIVAFVIIIVIFLVIKIAGAAGGATNNKETTAETTIAETESVDSSNMITVPDLTGMTEAQAQKALNDVNLGYKATKQPSDTVEAGKVVTQGSKAGSKVAKYTTVTISISEGITSFAVPVVTKMSEANATTKLKDAGLEVSIAPYEYSDTVDKGLVISQSPASGSVKNGDKVTLVVSRGKETKNVTVPNLISLDESTARQAVEALGLVADTTTRKASSETAGTVISQNYTVGKSVPEGTTISLTISTGPEVTTTKAPTTAKVPDVVNKKYSEAQTILANAKFEVSATSNDGTGAVVKPTDIVISQIPNANQTAEIGSTIKLVVTAPVTP